MLPLGVKVAVLKSAFLALVAAVPCHRADGADRQAVVAAQHDGQPPGLKFRVQGVMQQLVPLHHFRQMAKAVDGLQPRVGRAMEVAAVFDIQPQLRQGLRQARHAQCLRPHAGTEHTGSNVGGDANQTDAAWGEVGVGGKGAGVHAADANAGSASRRAASAWPREAGRIRLNRSFGLASSGSNNSRCPRPNSKAVSRR